jgi:hypothetical protein
MGESPGQPQTDPHAGARAVYVAPGVSRRVPVTLASAGKHTADATLEFSTSRIPNAHTKKAYDRTVFAVCKWCKPEGERVAGLRASTVSTYRALLRAGGNDLSLPSVKCTASAIRHWLDFLTERGVAPKFPPARYGPNGSSSARARPQSSRATMDAGSLLGSSRSRQPATSSRRATVRR